MFWLTRPLLGSAAFAPPGEANDPDLLAYAEPERYRKALHLFVVESWQRQGDDQYRLLTLDSLIEAALCYEKALRLIGVLPESLSTAPLQAPSLADAKTESFTPPLNNKLVELRNLLRNRQFNLRHGLTLDGKPASIMLEPDALDRIAMGDGDVSREQGSAAITARVVPPCRFDEARKCAGEAVLQLIELGQSQLRFYESEAALRLALASKKHMLQQLEFPCRLQEQALELARHMRNTVLASREMVLQKKAYYQGLVDEGITDLEHASQALAYMSKMALGVSTIFSASSAIIDATVPTIYGLAFGGSRPAKGIAMNAMAFDMASKICDMTKDELRLQADYQLRSQQWQFEADQAALELQLIDKQLREQDIQIHAASIAVQEAHAKLAAHRVEYEIMTSVFFNQPTCLWLIGRMSEIFSAAYDATLSLCLMAEACLQYELGDFSNTWIKTNGWLDNWHGMLAGEALERDLMQMDVAAIRDNGRPLDIRKDLSLLALKNWKLEDLHNALRSDVIQFDLAPWHFDEDFPGHYLRRIERIVLSFDAEGARISAPLPAMLYQTSNTVLLTDDLLGAEHLYSLTNDAPPSVLRDLRPNQNVAIWSAKEVSRRLDLQPSVTDKTRYQPFEGTGLFSSWTIKFPGGANNISALYHDNKWQLKDISLEISYSSLQGSEVFADKVKQLLAQHKAGTLAGSADTTTVPAPGNADNALVSAREAEHAALKAVNTAQTETEAAVLQSPETAAQASKANQALTQAREAAKSATAARQNAEAAAKAGKVTEATAEAEKAQDAAKKADAAAKDAADARVAAENIVAAQPAVVAARTAEQTAIDALTAAQGDAEAQALKAPEAIDQASKAAQALTQAREAAKSATAARQNAEAAAKAGKVTEATAEAEKAQDAAKKADAAAKDAADARVAAENIVAAQPAVVAARTAEQTAIDALTAAQGDAEAQALKAPEAASEASKAAEAVTQAHEAVKQATAARQRTETAANIGKVSDANAEAEQAQSAAERALAAAKEAADARRVAERTKPLKTLQANARAFSGTYVEILLKDGSSITGKLTSYNTYNVSVMRRIGEIMTSESNRSFENIADIKQISEP